MTNEPPSSINKQWKQIGREANLTAQKILQSTYSLFQITTQRLPIDLGEASDSFDKQIQVGSIEDQGLHLSSISKSLLEIVHIWQGLKILRDLRVIYEASYTAVSAKEWKSPFKASDITFMQNWVKLD